MISISFASGKYLMLAAPSIRPGAADEAEFQNALPVLREAGIEVLERTGGPDVTTQSLEKSVDLLIAPPPSGRADLLSLKRWTDTSVLVGSDAAIPFDSPNAAPLRNPLLHPCLPLWKTYATRAEGLLGVGSPAPDLLLFVFGGSESGDAEAVGAIQRALIERRLFAANVPPAMLEEYAAAGNASTPPILAIGLSSAGDAERELLGKAERAGVRVLRSDSAELGSPPIIEHWTGPRIDPRIVGGPTAAQTPAAEPSAIWIQILDTVKPVIEFETVDLGFRGLGAGARRPDDKLPSGEFPLRQHHRVIDGMHFFWLSNPTDQKQSCSVIVRGMNQGGSIWNCETGTIQAVPVSLNGMGARLQLSFEPFESYWLGFDRPPATVATPAVSQWTVATLAGPWQAAIDRAAQPAGVALDKVPADLLDAGRALDSLESIPALGLDGFQGVIDLRHEFEMPETEDAAVWLDLGQSGGAAEVVVNDVAVGRRAWPPYAFELTPHLQKGMNRVSIRMVHIAGNPVFAGPVTIVGRARQ